MSADASTATEPGRGSAAAWVIEHVPVARGFYAGRRAGGVAVQEQRLPAALDPVTVRRFARPAPAASASPSLVVMFPDALAVAQRGRRSGEWLASSLAGRLPLTVDVVHIPGGVIDDREAALSSLLNSVETSGASKIALLGVGTGGALAARTAMRVRDAGTPVLARQVLIAPDFQLIAGPPATGEAQHTSLVARLGELPATLVQQYGERSASRLDPSQNLTELLRESGVAVRAIDYPPSKLDWTEYPRAVRSASRALDDLVAFLERGIVTDGFDVVPAWNLH